MFSDLTGERGVLMGALAGIMEAQYDVLRAHGHTPSEAFNETVEELTQSLIRLVDENGMDWMYSNCSATAQRGALDWKPKFKKATLPVFKELYKRVKIGQGMRPRAVRLRRAAITRRSWRRNWAKSTIPKCGAPARLPARCVQSNPPRLIAKGTKGVSGRTAN